jgi:2'-5' RNA ligase
LLAAGQDKVLAEFPVASFQLFSSRLTPGGPQYKVLQEMTLGQP